MKQRIFATFAIVYVVNWVMLFCAPYSRFWEHLAYSLVQQGALSWTEWALAAEGARLVMVVVLGIGIALLLERQESPSWSIPNSQTGDDSEHTASVQYVKDALDGMRGRERATMLKTLAIRLPNELTSHEAVALLGPLRDQDRLDGIKVLAGKLAATCELAPLLKGLHAAQRVEAAKLLN